MSDVLQATHVTGAWQSPLLSRHEAPACRPTGQDINMPLGMVRYVDFHILIHSNSVTADGPLTAEGDNCDKINTDNNNKWLK